MFDEEELGELLGDVLADGPGCCSIDLNLDMEKLSAYDFDENIYFTGIFAYTLSRFMGNEKILFNIVNNDLNVFQLYVDCENQDIDAFMSNIVKSIEFSKRNPYNVTSNINFNFGLKEFDSGDFNANVVKNSDDYTLKIRYSEIYSKNTVERFLNSFKLISKNIFDAEELSEITYTTSSDLELLDSYNQTEHDLKYNDVLDAFNAHLASHPENNLVTFKDKAYTYGEGAFIADRIAKKLTDLGVKPQDSVAFLTQRSEWYLLNVLSIMSVGAVYVPLDNNLPDERIELILEDTDSKVFIVSDETYERCNSLNNNAIILNVSEILKEDIGTLSKLDVSYGNVACVLYTSGTTGVPKGVKITRKSIINVCEWYCEKYPFSSNDVYGLYASIGFDVASFNINVAMYAGACLSVVPNEYKTNMVMLNEYFIEQSVTHTWITTQVGKLFMSTVDKTSLDFLMVGGEKLGDIENPKDFTLTDVCGPTEAFEHICSIRYTKKIDVSSIGHLNYNTKAYVLDDEFRRVPFGAVGELYLSGYQIADGYLNRPEKTKEAFLNNPFCDEEGHEVLYKTGDIVRILPDGSIGIVGRRDSQVKIRGNRVELSEVESVIREINYVEDVTVQTVKHGDNFEIVAYVVPSIETDTLKDQICDYVSNCKPDYMIPSYVIELESIPLNINGKVDKNSLPKVDLSSLKVDYVAPTTENEKIIVNAFEKVFNQENIGLYDDFIRMGGDSISAIRVVSILQKNGISCSARDIINYQTPYLIAQNIQEVNYVSYESVEGEVDLLPIQSYFFDKINANRYSQEYILKSKVELDINILQKAFNEVSKTHDMLRAVYEYEDDDIVQKILPVDSCVCEIDEVFIEDDIIKSIEKILLDSNRSLDISGDLIKITLLHYNNTSYIILVIHHLIIDGVSWSILIDDLTYFYTLLLENKKPKLSKPYPYKSWVEDVKKLASNISESEKQHWIDLNNQLDDSLIKGKSSIFIFNVNSQFDAGNLLMLSEEEYLALCIARAYKITYGKDIIFNKESYGRDESIADVNRTIGWFTSQYPVSVNVNSKYDNVSLVQDVYNLKIAFKDVKHLGINYGSLIYGTDELEFKHCPVTLNFVSNEFVYRNKIFESLDEYLSSNDKINLRSFDTTSYGISLRISRVNDNYVIGGDYAEDTYISDKLEEFIDNIKYELEFIGNYQLEKENIVCCLSESQLGIYLDEKVRKMGTAYSTQGLFKCDSNKSVDEIKKGINRLIKKHPILKTRIVEGEFPLMVCDANPVIEVVENKDCSELIEPFNLNDYLSRFYIIENGDKKSIFFEVHHIISDGTNCHLIYEELTKIFEDDFDDSTDLGFLYENNNHFENRYKNIYEEAHEFYRENLSDIDETSTLLFDGNGHENRIRLPIHGIKNSVINFCHKNKITIGNLFNAVFAYTYSRFTGSDKIFYTYTQHGRHNHYAQKALGMFARTVPIIIDCSNSSVNDYLINVSDLVLNSMKYSMYPYRLLANEFDLNLNSAFEYNYNLNDVSDIGDELIIENVGLDLISDFVCVVNDLDDGYLIRIDSCDKYSDELIINFLNAFKEILIQILDKEELSDIDYISSSDLKLLENYNQTDYPLEYGDILDAFNDNLGKYPQNKLVSYKDKSYSYSQGAFLVDKIALKLRDANVKQQDSVAFLVERSEWYLFNSLAILSVGAVSVPLDDAHPDERIDFILKDAGVKVIIVSDSTYERALNLSEDYILVNISDIESEKIEALSELDVNYGNLGSILYTSGTTGVPKGVKITRKSIINISSYHSDYYGLKNSDVYSLFASIGFDVAIKCMFTPICCGASLDIIPEDVKLDMNKLNEHLTSHKVTYADIPTQVAKLFIDQVENTTLKYLFTGGEKLGEFNGDCSYHLIDSYGPTEACVDVSCVDSLEKIDSTSIGHLIYNTKAYILDNEFRRVPIGAVGELYLAGYQISDGYLNRPEENEKAFLANPFEEDENYNILYRTGDIVRILNDGSLGIVGRRDGQVKIRGNRVELMEVEEAIREIDYIVDVTVQTIKNYGNNELVAYVVTSEEIDDIKEKISNHISESKPSYMIPSFVISLDKIPLTVNGKVDRHALPKVNLNSLRGEYVAPTTEKEKIIVRSFETVFDQRNIGIHDDFVHLGGDSIVAIRLISLLQKQEISCTARDILTYKTPYLIAQNVKEVKIVTYKPVEGPVDLHPIQSFFFDQVNSDYYSQEYILKSEIPLELNTLQKAFDELCNIHDMLRATYKYDGENIIQEIQPENTSVCEIKEYSSDDDLNRTLAGIIQKSNRTLNISDELIKISILHHEGECYLIFVIHHLIIDGVSWSVLLDDLTNIYKLVQEGNEIDILRPYPYKLWVEDLKELVSDISESEKQHWFEIDAQLDDSLIKGESKLFASNINGFFNRENKLMLTEEEYLGLSIARAYKKTYGRDIIVNRESHGRDELISDVNRTIGWFTSQFPVPINVNGKYDNISLVEDVCSLKKAFKNQKHLSLNYGSLVYTTHDLEYKHCPVTFNFLSSEFTFKNEIFKSLDEYLSNKDIIEFGDFDSISYGITLNITRVNNNYIINGDYGTDTYLADKFNEFINNIEEELRFIGEFEPTNIICPLSESQLGLYLDEKVNDMGTAYSAPGLFKCDENNSIDEIKEAIHKLIEKHPILKSRVIDGEIPLSISDSYPSIEVVNTDDFSTLIKPFDLKKSLIRFFIVENNDGKFIFYDSHHIINDATTGMLILKEFEEIFNGEFDETIDYGFIYDSFKSFEAKFKNSYEKGHEFYRKNLSSIDETSPLLYDGGGSRNTIKLPVHGIKNQVKEFSHKNGITVSNLLNAVFAYTYSRFTGGDKVYYAYTQHGRNDQYIKNSLGMFVRTIPIIIDCGNDSVKNYLANVSDLILDSMKYSDYPYRLLASEFNLNLDASFEYNYDLNDVSDIGNELIIEDMENDLISEFTCAVNDLHDGYLIRINSSDKYSDEFVIRFLKVFKEVLIQILDKNELSDIDYASSSDLKLLDSYNNTEHDLDYDDLLDAFNDNLKKYPQNQLVKYENNSYTYSQGAFVADKIAKKLIKLGVKVQDTVSFLVQRSELYLLSALGIMSIGGVYVPLDDSHPNERIQFMISDTASKVLIVSDETYQRAKDLSNDITLLNISDILREDIGSLHSLPSTYGNLACILYTSGTTGLPKGVKVTRRSILNVISYYNDAYGLTSDDVYGLFSTIGFDAGSLAICQTLYSGCCLSIIPESIRLDMNSLNNYFINQGITHTMLTTQIGKLFMENIEDTSLKVLLVGGEKLGEFKDPNNYKLIDGFGPTETFAFISSIENSQKIDSSSIGMLNYNTKVYILDNEYRRVPFGAVGELYVAGPQVAKGYLKREDENKTSFIDNPFDSDENYNVLYRSGDMVRILADGSLAIVGRRDSQVKIRGNRVELSEIEGVIREIEYVNDVTVQTIKNKSNNELVAYVVSDKTDDLKDSICEYVKNSKPDYMVPSFVVKLDKIPLTVNGKVDARALPKIDVDSLRSPYVAPTTEDEKAIVKAFETTFNQKDIGLNDDFIRLGGDSISSIRIISILQKNGILCTAKDILKYKTPYLIAQNITKAVKKSYDATEGIVDLLPIQKYFFDKVNANDFSQEFVLKANKKLNHDILQKSFNELTVIHDMLRSTYTIENNEITQEIKPENSNICEIAEISLNDNFDGNISDIINESKKSLDLKDNLIKISHIHYNDESYLVLVIHHLIIDGVSWSILIDDLAHIYNIIEKSGEVEIPRPYPYKLWVSDVKRLASNISCEEKEHWIEVNSLLNDSLIEGDSQDFKFNADMNFNPDNLLMLSEEEYWTLAVARAYKKTYDKNIIINMESYGRDETINNVSRTVGWFTSQYPVSFNLNCRYDDISLINDINSLKTSLKGVKHLGLNYQSLIYDANELEYKYCPVTFNFLSTEFTFKNEMFESIGEDLSKDTKLDSKTHGITLNVLRLNDSYLIDGIYARDTYLSDKFEQFIENIKHELDFIGNYNFKNGIICPLSEEELGIYLDELVYERGNAYAASDFYKCEPDKTVDEIKDAIHRLINKYPILKARVIDSEDVPLIICDSNPSIEIADTLEYSELIKPFDLSKYSSRFYIIESNEEKYVFCDFHHLIMDATSINFIKEDLHNALNGNLKDTIDLGFLYNSRDSFEAKFENKYEEAHEFYRKNLSKISETKELPPTINGAGGSVCLPIRGVRKQFEEFSENCGITTGNLLHAIFAYTLSRITGSDKTFFTFIENGRHESYIQKSVDSFVRTIPIVIDCENKSIKEYLNDVSDLLINSMNYSAYPYRLLSNEFKLNRGIMFEYLYDLNDLPEIGNEMFFEDKRDLFCELFCVINDLKDGYLVNIDYSDTYSRETGILFVNVFNEVLTQMLTKKDLADIDCGEIDLSENKTVKESDDLNIAHEYIAPTTENEKIIVDVFEELLDQKVGLHDDFIELGGNSLTAIKIKSKLSSKSINLEVKDIYSLRTPFNIAKHIGEKMNTT